MSTIIEDVAGHMTTCYFDPGCTAEEAVDAGIALLDNAEDVPADWREIIDWTRLDIDDSQGCVLGQLFAGEDEATAWDDVFEKFLKNHPEIDNIAKFGFTPGWHGWKHSFEGLENIWRDRAVGLLP